MLRLDKRNGSDGYSVARPKSAHQMLGATILKTVMATKCSDFAGTPLPRRALNGNHVSRRRRSECEPGSQTKTWTHFAGRDHSDMGPGLQTRKGAPNALTVLTCEGRPVQAAQTKTRAFTNRGRHSWTAFAPWLLRTTGPA
jgi:hypothetical protein